MRAAIRARIQRWNAVERGVPGGGGMEMAGKAYSDSLSVSSSVSRMQTCEGREEGVSSEGEPYCRGEKFWFDVCAWVR